MMPSPSISNVGYSNQFVGFYNSQNNQSNYHNAYNYHNNGNNNSIIMDMNNNNNNDYMTNSFKSSQVRNIGATQYYNMNLQNNSFNMQPFLNNNNNSSNNGDAPMFRQSNFFQYPQNINNFQPMMRSMSNININYTNPELLVVIPFNFNVFNNNNNNNFGLL